MASPPMTRSSVRALLALVALALLLDFLFYTGFYASDDIGYLDGIRAVAGDTSFVPDIGNTRMGITLPGAVVYWISSSISAVAWFHVLYHLALVVLAYLLARRLHDDRAGLLAAALIAINPLLYGHAGAILPDNATACWLAASMLWVIRTQQDMPLGEGIRSWDRKRFTSYVIAGALLGGGYMCKETSLIMTVPAAVLVMTGTRLRNLIWIQHGAALALGLAAVIVLDLLVLRVINGDWLLRTTLVSDAARLFLRDMETQGTHPLDRFAFAHAAISSWTPWTLWLFTVAGAVYGALPRRNVGVMAFFWFPAIYLTIGSTSFTRYLPATIQGRYYAIVLVPAAVMTAAIASKAIQRWRDTERTGWIHRIGPRLVLVIALGAIAVKEYRANWGRSGRIYMADEVGPFVTAVETTRERYPQYPIVVSPHYLYFMRPLLDRLPIAIVPPAPPYVYIERVANLDHGAPRIPPPHGTRHLHTAWPAHSRIAIVADAVRRMIVSGPRKKLRLRTNSPSGAAVFLIEPP